MSRQPRYAVKATSNTVTIFADMTAEESRQQLIKESLDRAREEVAYMIRLGRVMTGMSQRDLAKKAGTSQAVISRYEKGKWESIRKAQEVLNVFHLNLDVELLTPLGNGGNRE